jgi:hypothetical protein
MCLRRHDFDSPDAGVSALEPNRIKAQQQSDRAEQVYRLVANQCSLVRKQCKKGCKKLVA